MVILLRGVPTEAEATALYNAGTRCADLDGVCSAAHTGGGSMMGGPRGVSVLAAFAAATAHSGSCAAISGGANLVRPFLMASVSSGPSTFERH